MDLKIKNKICIITGGAKGIGYSIAKLWAIEGGIPIVFSRSISKKHDQELKSLCENYEFYELDLKNYGLIKDFVIEVATKHGGIYALVNNAGMNDNLHIENVSIKDSIQSYENNLFHYYTMTKECLPYIKKEQGSILNIVRKQALQDREKPVLMLLQKRLKWVLLENGLVLLLKIMLELML